MTLLQTILKRAAAGILRPASIGILIAILFVVTIPFGPATQPSANAAAAKVEPTPVKRLPEQIELILMDSCFDCHEAGLTKGGVRLDNFSELAPDKQVEMLNKIEQQVYLRQMPPQKRDPLPGADWEALLGWVTQEFEARGNKSKFREKLRNPKYGNFVDHDALFSGEHAHKQAYTPDRQWLINEYIFNEKVDRILDIQRTMRRDREPVPVLGRGGQWPVRITNPFQLPKISGVRYYDNAFFNGGHFLTMLGNSSEMANHMFTLSQQKNDYLPAIKDIMFFEWQNDQTLEDRIVFLDKHAERVIVEAFGDRHEALLPQYVPTAVKVLDGTQSLSKNTAPRFGAAVLSNEEMFTLWRSYQAHRKDGATDAEAIEQCDREWQRHGHHEQAIVARLYLLHNYKKDLPGWFDRPQIQAKTQPFDYEPLSDGEMAAISESLLKHRQRGDTYAQVIEKCIEEWVAGFQQALADAGPPPVEQIDALVEQLFVKIYEREPAEREAAEYRELALAYAQELGRKPGILKLIQTLIMNTEFVYRSEFGVGEPDEAGRRMMSPRDASYALAYALTDSSPDAALVKAAQEGRLSTREDYRREVRRMLSRRDIHYAEFGYTNMPIRELRFFRDFFGYPKMMEIFKDSYRFGKHYDRNKGSLLSEADLLVAHIVEKDKDVFETLLTTEDFYVYHSGQNAAMEQSAKRLSNAYNYFKDKGWKDFTEQDLVEHKEALHRLGFPGVNPRDPGTAQNLRAFKGNMTMLAERFAAGQTYIQPFLHELGHGPQFAFDRSGYPMPAYEVPKFFNLDTNTWDYPTQQPAKIANRKGMLTHPAWLIAHAHNTHSDPIKRGKWVREKLLAGMVPDLPITVDAVIPEDPDHTLRTRLARATEAETCWNCHVHMNPLGYPFEIYDDFGRYRTEEMLEYPQHLIKPANTEWQAHKRNIATYKTLPVDSTGFLDGTGDSALDGEVADAFDLIDRLAKSERVRQSIIRHAFRYFMGRNETLSDSKTLIDADKAYVESGGSFDAVIESLLTSDSFIYRKDTESKD